MFCSLRSLKYQILKGLFSDCNSVYAGSIPTRASNQNNNLATYPKRRVTLFVTRLEARVGGGPPQRAFLGAHICWSR
jgi:hypothetical protein